MTEIAKQFFDACQLGDVQLLRTQLASYPFLVSERDANGATALHHATAHVDCIHALLAAGADPNARENGDNITPLHIAAAHGNVDSMRALLDAGADVHGAGDMHNGDVIGWAVGDGSHLRLAAVALLIEHGARHHIFSAIALGDAELVRSVVESDPNALQRRRSKFEQEQTALHFALSSPNSHGPPKKSQYEIASLLIQLGADIEAKDTLGRTPLMVAMMQGELAAARLLANAGAIMPAIEEMPDIDEQIAALRSSMYTQLTPMLCVSDVDVAVQWYQSIGFSLNERAPEMGKIDWASMSMGEARIMLQSLVARPRNQVALWFHSNRVDALYELYKHRQLVAARELLNNSAMVQMETRFYEDLYSPFYGGRQFSLRDVNGLEIVFYSE